MSDLNILKILKRELQSKVDDYVADDYEGIAFHSSSIVFLANDVAADMFGYSANELFGLNAWRLFSDESFDTIMQHLVEKSEEPYQVKGIKKDETEFDVELKGSDFEVHGEPIRSVMLKKINNEAS